MSEFINTIDALGEEAVMDGIICRTITEFKDNTLTEIGDNAFAGCAALATIDLPNLTKAGSGVFFDCKALTDVNLPQLTYINPKLFYGCSGLVKLTLPSVTGSGYQPLGGCHSLEYIDIASPSFNGFSDNNNGGGGPALKQLIIRSETLCNFTPNILKSSPNVYVYVPSALLESYKTHANFITYADRFRAIEDYTVDGTITGEMREHCESIALDVIELTFTDANSYTLTATGVFGVLDPIVWCSSDPAVAQVDNNGVVTPVGDGAATITATCGEVSATCLVTVNAGLEYTNVLYDVGFNSGYLAGGDGTEKAATSDRYTDKFVISDYAGSSIVVVLNDVTTTAANSRICYYDASEKFISATSGSGATNPVTITSTVPSNATYAAISIAKDNNFSIEITCSGDVIGSTTYAS